MNTPITKQDAREFFREHSEWLGNSWGTTPEGREYKARFDAAVAAALDPTVAADSAQASWEKNCEVILRQPETFHSHSSSNYIRAIKFTREVFGLDLKQAKDKVDELRQRLCL